MTKRIKQKLYDIVFEADTPSGKAFDIVLLITIGLSILVVMLESVQSLNIKYIYYFKITEWIITIIFTLEYILRIWIVNKPFRYIFSFFGIIDLLSTLPTYLAIFMSGSQAFIILRSLRLLRVFRILKLSRYIHASSTIISALKASRVKISVFLYAVMMLTIIMGTLMYWIEGGESGFTSIPQGIYWAVVTITTVGYGDIAPVTTVGKILAGFMMVLGYAIIAVPTGIVTSEFTQINNKVTTQVCPECLSEGHESDAVHCKFCGSKL